MKIAPFTSKANRTRIIKIPKIVIYATGFFKSPNERIVCGFATISEEFLSPKNAINNPIAAEIPCLKLLGIESIKLSRNFVADKITKIIAPKKTRC